MPHRREPANRGRGSAGNNSQGPPKKQHWRRNAESSIDRERRRAYKIEAKKRAKIEAKATRDKQLKWSEVAITFDKADCKDTSDLSGLNPIVVQPVMCGRQVHDVLVDGGSSLNILNAHILDEMCIFPSDIEPVIRSIEGVVSGVSATSIEPVIHSTRQKILEWKMSCLT
jgi:hypothetical protein